MAKKKFYAVRIGKEPGIYESWSECEQQVKGFKSAEYKSFATVDEAEQYMHADNEVNVEKGKTKSDEEIDYDKIITSHLNDNRLVAFTDGGYSGKNKICGYGVYIIKPHETSPIEISDIVKTDRFIHSNNIGPEVMAVISAFDWALSNGYDKITIFHDFKGIGEWGVGNWNANSEIAIWFVKKINEKYKDLLDIKYIWVPGHKGIEFNEVADRLATEAMNKNKKPQIKLGVTYFTCKSVGEKDVQAIIKKMDEDPEIKINKLQDQDIKIIWKISRNKEKTTITFHKKTCAAVVQGKPNGLFSLFISFYTEKIPDFDLVLAYATMRGQRIEFNDVESYTQTLNLPADFPIDCIKLIKQAISEKMALQNGYNKNAYDFGHYVFPACRALEGTIKYLFEECGTHIRKQDNIGGYFDCDATKRYYLKGKKYETMRFKTHLENAYNKYYSNRHNLGHFGELICNIDNDTTTMMVENENDAIQIIDDILDVIKFD